MKAKHKEPDCIKWTDYDTFVHGENPIVRCYHGSDRTQKPCLTYWAYVNQDQIRAWMGSPGQGNCELPEFNDQTASFWRLFEMPLYHLANTLCAEGNLKPKRPEVVYAKWIMEQLQKFYAWNDKKRTAQ